MPCLKFTSCVYQTYTLSVLLKKSDWTSTLNDKSYQYPINEIHWYVFKFDSECLLSLKLTSFKRMLLIYIFIFHQVKLWREPTSIWDRWLFKNEIVFAGHGLSSGHSQSSNVHGHHNTSHGHATSSSSNKRHNKQKWVKTILRSYRETSVTLFTLVR